MVNPFEKAGVVFGNTDINHRKIGGITQQDIDTRRAVDSFLTIPQMFQQIWDYHDKLGHDASEDKIQIIRDGCLALYQEVAELTDSFPWKPWREPKDQTHDKDNACREIVDIFFFLAKIMRAAGITSEELIAKFYWVLNNNLNRLENGYSKKGGENEENQSIVRQDSSECTV